MCVPGCRETVERNLSRRGFLGAALAAGTLGAPGCGLASPRPPSQEPIAFPAFRQVIDLTHTYSARFPHFRGGGSKVEVRKEFSTDAGDDWNSGVWTLDEHAGTHIDAPYHKNAKGLTAEKIPARDLVLPLAVIDIRAKASGSADALLTVEDVKAWEAKHGPLPARACVALLSGWDSKVETPAFFGFDAKGERHFPGFHVDAIEHFLAERDVVAIASDTASFDPGNTVEFPVHTRWLGSNRWGLENAARLGELPPRGATLVCGAPKIEGATGGPSRALALL
jgi:kynurenine formamidase